VIIFPYGSEAQQSWEQGIKILADLFVLYRQNKLEHRLQKEEKNKRHFAGYNGSKLHKQSKHIETVFNVTQTASILDVHRQTIYYWIKKRWINPKRDYKGYPVFTVLDIENIIKWRKTIK